MQIYYLLKKLPIGKKFSIIIFLKYRWNYNPKITSSRLINFILRIRIILPKETLASFGLDFSVLF